MFGFDDQVEAFARDPQLDGIRLVFQPDPEKGQSSAFSLRIESFNNDPRSLYIENQASFGPIMVEQGLDGVEDNVLSAYRFVVEETLRFVNRFDAPQQAEEA
jgi:hypothetical protein